MLQPGAGGVESWLQRHAAAAGVHQLVQVGHRPLDQHVEVAGAQRAAGCGEVTRHWDHRAAPVCLVRGFSGHRATRGGGSGSDDLASIKAIGNSTLRYLSAGGPPRQFAPQRVGRVAQALVLLRRHVGRLGLPDDRGPAFGAQQLRHLPLLALELHLLAVAPCNYLQASGCGRRVRLWLARSVTDGRVVLRINLGRCFLSSQAAAPLRTHDRRRTRAIVVGCHGAITPGAGRCADIRLAYPDYRVGQHDLDLGRRSNSFTRGRRPFFAARVFGSMVTIAGPVISASLVGGGL